MRFLTVGETVAVRLMRALHCGFAPDSMKYSASGQMLTVNSANLS
jgi:hypothetical protein